MDQEKNKIDIQIFQQMVEYGFKNSNAIASKLNMDPQTVRRRIKKMKDKGVFEVVLAPNFIKLGFKAWARIGLKVDPHHIDKVSQWLIKHPSIYFVTYCFDTYDILIGVKFPNTNLLTDFIHYDLNQIEGIIRKETILFDRPLKYYKYAWPIKISSSIDTNYDSSSYHPTELDLKIFEIWSKDALVRPDVIKNRIGVSESLIRKRMKIMKDEKLVDLTPIPNDQVFKDMWVTVCINSKYCFNDNQLDNLLKDSHIYLAAICLGKYDLVIGAHFGNLDVLSEFINNKLHKIKGVQSTQTIIYTKPLKYHNLNFVN